MTSLPSILVLGADSVAAAMPATPIQLAHACREWGFSSVVPASWGDELLATDVVQHCAGRDNRPVIQCSCPRVFERLANSAVALGDAILWRVSPPVAAARYLRQLEGGRQIHITYAGECPGAIDPSIDERISPRELLAALTARGIDLARQPTVFENVIPPDRRRHMSLPGGLPEQHRLWETAQFRVAQPSNESFALAVAQLLLADERLLIDISSAVGCLCRTADGSANDVTTIQRSPTPVVLGGQIDLSQPAPSPRPPSIPDLSLSQAVEAQPPVAETQEPTPTRSSVSRPHYRRHTAWRRQSPRPGAIVARPSAVAVAIISRVPLLRRPEARWLITVLLIATALMVGVWLGRRAPRSPPGTVGTISQIRPSSSALPAHFRSP